MEQIATFKSLVRLSILLQGMVAFSVQAQQAQVEVVARFGAGANGILQFLQGADGNFYGNIGREHGGEVFKVTPGGSVTTLRLFTDEQPWSLVQGSDGNLYGTLTADSSWDQDIFRLTPSGAFSKVWDFLYPYPKRVPTKGASRMFAARNGDLYAEGGVIDDQLNGYQALFHFTGGDLVPIYTTANDFRANYLSEDGNFYCERYLVESGQWQLFRVAPSGSVTTLGVFARYHDIALQADDGTLYGFAEGNKVFKWSPSGSLTTLVSLTKGFRPHVLIQGLDGNFYGLTLGDGTNGAGTVFKLSPSGTLTLVSLPSEVGDPRRIVQGKDGQLYVCCVGETGCAIARVRVAHPTELKAIEVNQVIQNWNNSIPLIAGKKTYVRVHLQSAIPTNVVGTLRAFNASGAELPGPPIVPLNPGFVTPSDAHVARTNFESSLNFLLPDHWTAAGRVTLQFEPTNGVALFSSAPGVTTNANNQFRMSAEFLPAPDFRLSVWLVLQEKENWPFGPEVRTPSLEEVSAQVNFLKACYPVAKADIRFGWMTHRVNDWDGGVPLLKGLHTSLKRAHENDHDKADIYYALVHGTNRVIGMAEEILESFKRGKATPTESTVASGYGAYGVQREVLAHEVAHVLGMEHTIDENLGLTSMTISNVPISATQGRSKTKEYGRYLAEHFPFWRGDLARICDVLAPTNELVYGLDTSIAKPSVVAPWRTVELMSYSVGDYNWVSEFTYTNMYWRLRARFGAASASPVPVVALPKKLSGPAETVPGTYILVRGDIDLASRTVAFAPMSRISRMAPPAYPEDGDLRLVLRDRLNNMVGSIPFSVLVSGEIGEWDGTARFSVLVPSTNQLSSVSVVDGSGAVLGTKVASASAPEVRLSGPNGGEVFTNGTMVIAWDGSDPDGDALSYDVEYSPDDGQTWELLAFNLEQKQLSVPLNRLRATTEGRIRVVASDGFNTSVDQSDANITFANNAPEFLELKVSPEGPVMSNEAVFVKTTVIDVEDGMLGGTNLVWTSSESGVLGTGPDLSLGPSALPVGNHVITLSAFDSNGASIQTNVALTVWQAQDVGAATNGSVAISNQTFLVQGGGTDIWGQEDAFRFVTVRFSGDGEIVARVISIDNTDPWAKAGVMMRETLASNSKYALIAVTPTNGITFQNRQETGGYTSGTGQSGATAIWLRLVRQGDLFTGYFSTDGISWVEARSQTIKMAPEISVGLAVTAHDSAALNMSSFDNVRVGSLHGVPEKIMPILQPNDFIIAVDLDGASDFPAAEGPTNALDANSATKYLNFGQTNAGFIVTPAAGRFVVKALRFQTANDVPERDPAAWALYGTDAPILSTNNSTGTAENWAFIAQGNMSLPLERLTLGGLQSFTNNTPYTSYRLVITAVREPLAAQADSVQFSEIQFFGSNAPALPPRDLLLNRFDSIAELSESGHEWSQGASTWDGTIDAGGGSAIGALHVTAAYVPADPTAWQETQVARNLPWNEGNYLDLAPYAYFECDLKVDTNGSVPAADGNWGQLKPVFQTADWSWQELPTIDIVGADWIHVKQPIASVTPQSLARLVLSFHSKWGVLTSNNISYWIDNVRLSAPPERELHIGSDGSLGFSDGRFGFDILGNQGQLIVIESSSDLLHWIPVWTNTLESNPVYFSDPDSGNASWRFYRARLFQGTASGSND